MELDPSLLTRTPGVLYYAAAKRKARGMYEDRGACKPTMASAIRDAMRAGVKCRTFAVHKVIVDPKDGSLYQMAGCFDIMFVSFALASKVVEELCEGCDGDGVRDDSTQHTKLPVPEGYVVVERCDGCQKFDGDLEAARSIGTDAHWLTAAYPGDGNTDVVVKPHTRVATT